jgi:hypothetical protein
VPDKDKWISDFDDLTGEETDRAFGMIGVDATGLAKRPMSLACAVAVVTRQRTDPDLPDETWRTLKLRDIEVVSQIDAADEKDPT